MKLRPLTFLLLGSLLALAGCNTTASRIQQKSEVFASLPPADQARLRKGDVAIGDTPDMVFIAIGAPDRRIERTSAGARRMEWIYRRYDESYEGEAFAGYRRRVAFDPRTGRRFIYSEPVYADVYRSEVEEHLRVTFENGRVSAIDELKH
jgi:hypothetical protein